jgi:hypothetical protein
MRKTFKFQTEAEALAVKRQHQKEFSLLAIKYNVDPLELLALANDDLIEDTDDLFMIFKRSYVLSEKDLTWD